MNLDYFKTIINYRATTNKVTKKYKSYVQREVKMESNYMLN